MNRRDFLSTYGIGAVLTGSLTAGSAARGAALGTRKQQSIDPEKFQETAYRHFIPGKLTCGESILLAGCEGLGIESPLIPGIGLGLGGGVGFQGQTCGILTGSAMVLSLAIAPKESDYAKRMMRTLQAAGRVCNAFKQQFGATDCRTLCGLDLTTPEGRQKLKGGIKAQRCAELVRAGARLLANELRTA